MTSTARLMLFTISNTALVLAASFSTPPCVVRSACDSSTTMAPHATEAISERNLFAISYDVITTRGAAAALARASLACVVNCVRNAARRASSSMSSSSAPSASAPAPASATARTAAALAAAFASVAERTNPRANVSPAPLMTCRFRGVSAGNQRSASRAHVTRMLAGTTTRSGPSSRKHAPSASAWIVLPTPIWSAMRHLPPRAKP